MTYLSIFPRFGYTPRPMRRTLERHYRKMSDAYGPMRWWPGETRWEIMVGAILTQNTAWKNVEKAIAELKRAGTLEYAAMREAPTEALALMIRSSGYFNQKALKLKRLIAFMEERYQGRIEAMMAAPLAELRAGLLAVKGVGPETADSILLYALDHPIFVVDAYTRRILVRHRLVEPNADYHAMQAIFMRALPPNRELYNEYHALIVRTGHYFCSKRGPNCGACPLGDESPIDAAWTP